MQRKTLHDLLSENPGPEGVVIPLDFFHDVNDQDEQFDRVAVGTQTAEATYSGVAVIDDTDVPAFKKYMNEIWAGVERQVRVLPPREEGGSIRVARHDREITELVN